MELKPRAQHARSMFGAVLFTLTIGGMVPVSVLLPLHAGATTYDREAGPGSLTGSRRRGREDLRPG
jgi:hypothetical protein